MQSALHRLRSRLVAARVCLSGVPGPEGDAISAAQAAAVADLAAQAEVPTRSPEEKASLIDAIMAVAWHNNDRGTAMAAVLAEPPKDKGEEPSEGVGKGGKQGRGVGKGGGERRQQQRYFPAILAYFTHDDWQILLGANVGASVKMNLIYCRLTSLGAQNLSEPCKKYMAAVGMHLMFGAGAFAIPPHTRTTVQRDVKVAWEKWARRNKVPRAIYLSALPPCSETLQKEHPKLYAEVFPEVKPELCRIDMRVVESIDRLMNCRNISSGLDASIAQMSPATMQVPGAVPSLLYSPEGFQQSQAPPKCLQQLFAQPKLTASPTEEEPQAPPPLPITRVSSVRSDSLEEAQLAVATAASAASAASMLGEPAPQLAVTLAASPLGADSAASAASTHPQPAPQTQAASASNLHPQPAIADAELEETPIHLALETLVDADREGVRRADTTEMWNASSSNNMLVAAPGNAGRVRPADTEERVRNTDAQGEVPAGPPPPIAASMLTDFLQMSNSRKASSRKRKVDKGEGETAQPNADGKKARVFVDHESTRCTCRVRNRTLGGSRGFKYDAGDAKSKEAAKAKADAYCAEWASKS